MRRHISFVTICHDVNFLDRCHLSSLHLVDEGLKTEQKSLRSDSF
jgi:ATPase subunit of ABC transporter with duplicated ATPase domains